MKKEQILLKTSSHQAHAILLLPAKAKKTGVVIAHGAGGNMHASFINYFHERIAEDGFPCLKFNFPYSDAGKKAPDPQPVLLACFQKAMEAMPPGPLVIGGKSMGGRMASYLGSEQRVAGLFFLGYPLHPPGKQDQLRDQHLYTIQKPMFFASGTKDPFARIELLNATISRIGKPATKYLIEDGGHSFEVSKKSGRSASEILDLVAQELLSFLEKASQSR
jgi:predicted alpha/beta-hydrolase family hydrolase